MIELDAINSKIIKILLKDSRTKHSDIAKAVKISKGRVGYRIKKLIEQGIILGYKINFNYQQLGYTKYTLLIKLQKTSEKIRDEYVKRLKTHEALIWIGTTFSQHDFRVVLIAKDIYQLKKHIDDIHILLDHNIANVETLTRINKLYGRQHALTHTQDAQECKSDILDEKDWKIIQEFAKKPDATYREVGSNLGVTGEDVKYRFKKIMSSGVIESFSIGLNHGLTGIWWNSLFKVSNKHQEDNIISYLSNHKQVSNIIITKGPADIDCTWHSKDLNEAKKFLLDFRELFDGYIQNLETLIVSVSHLYPIIPKIVFEEKIPST